MTTELGTYSTPATTTPGFTPGLYVNMAMLEDTCGPEPTLLACSDGMKLFYPAAVNALIGEPESGKTWVALAAAADTLLPRHDGGRVLVIDIDHGGAASTRARLESLGVPRDILNDPARFRYAAPEEPGEISGMAADAQIWQPHLVVVDSVGELVPMYGQKSNDADGYTIVHRAALTPFAVAGAAVLAIDHTAKNPISAAYGAGGTMAKKRAIDGAMYRCSVVSPFAPGLGGRAELTLLKDRHGKVRERRQVAGEREVLAAKFVLSVPAISPGNVQARFYAPDPGERASAKANGSDVAELVTRIAELDPPPRSANDACTRLGGNRALLLDAYKMWRAGRVEGEPE